MKKFDENRERIPISAIKQYIYCKRRFALMFIDREWGSNYKIVEGDILHKKVDDPFFNEKRGDLHISRSVRVYSDKMNLFGVADIIEFNKSDTGIKLTGKNGLWNINPVDYKNGKPEESKADECQLCAIALCLEEMFSSTIPKGDLFYGKLRRRVEIRFTDELRSKTINAIYDIHEMLEKLAIPKKPIGQNCNLCSLADICVPEVFDKVLSNKSQISYLIGKE